MSETFPLLSDEQIELGRKATFSTGNPFFPCDSKTMRKAARWAEHQVRTPLLERIAELEREADALKVDAERYRWIRAQHWSGGPLAVVANPKYAVKLGYGCPSLDRLDAAIDAARTPKEPT